MRGRPTKSFVRQNILKVLTVRKMYGYELYKHYNKLFPPVHMRTIYYHLKKGVELGEIKMEDIEEKKGKFSWGTNVQHVYYGAVKKVKKEQKIVQYISQLPKETK